MSVYQDFPQFQQDEADEMLNTLAVDYFEFAKFTSLYGRAYGVITSELTGIDETYKDFVMTPCAQSALHRTLYTVQGQTERHLGYNLSTRYHYETVQYESPHMMTRWPGVERLNVQRTWHEIAGLEAVAITPYVLQNVTVSTMAGYPEVYFSSAVVRNPLNVWLRNAATDAAYVIDTTRKPRRSGNDWVVVINQARTPYNVLDQVNLQDRELIGVTITKPTLPTGAAMQPVYSGTDRIIPVHSVVDNGATLTYYLYIYTLVDPAFSERVADLVAGEFYKLLPSISFKYWLEADASVEVTVYHGDQSYVLTDTANAEGYSVHTALIDSEVGLYYLIIKKDGETVCERPSLAQFSFACGSADCIPSTVYAKIYYKTNPRMLADKFFRQIDSARTALIHKTASELPMEDCLCSIEVGFIGMAQRMYGDTYINPMSGVETFKYKHGQKHGQVEYKTIMDNLLYYRRPLILKNIQDTSVSWGARG